MIKRICIFGDSIACGSNDYEFGGWQNWLKVEFGKAGKFQNVFNLAISGRTSSDIVKRLISETKVRYNSSGGKDSMMIMIAAPINDTRFIVSDEEKIFDISQDQFTNNLKNILRDAEKLSNEVVFIGMTSIIDAKTNPWEAVDYGHSWNNEYIKIYNNILKDFCRKNDVYFIEMIDVIDDANLPDGLHPNADGHKKMYKTIKAFLVKNNIIVL